MQSVSNILIGGLIVSQLLVVGMVYFHGEIIRELIEVMNERRK